MNCKNCHDPLEKNAQFCDNCGAKVITSRITFKLLITEVFTNAFGVDSKFFLTLRKMFTHPEDVINEYIKGVRKRYVNPFAFLFLAAAISLLVFNYFEEEFIEIQSSVTLEQVNELKKKSEIDLSKQKNISEKELEILKLEKKGAEIQLNLLDKMWQYMLRYFNLLTFINLLFYAILSKWTYRKPHNFGEHIVINAYIFGFITYLTLVLFLVAIVVHPTIYLLSFFSYFVFYLYAFGKLYQLSFWKSILKFFRFLIGLLLCSIAIILLIAIISLILKFIITP